MYFSAANTNPNITGTEMINATVGEEVRVELIITDAEDDATEAVFVGNLTDDYQLKMEGGMHVFLWTPTSVQSVILRYIYIGFKMVPL